MNDKTYNSIKQIKDSFRGHMNGIASKSMSEKGLAYKINWGIPLSELRHMACRIKYDYELVTELWKENIRECKILATLISASNQLPKEVAERWMEDVNNQELAEMLAFNTLYMQQYAIELASKWIEMDNAYKKICGYAILARNFTAGNIPDTRDVDKLITHAFAALRDKCVGVRHSAYNFIIKFDEIDDKCHSKVKLLSNGTDFKDFL